MDNKIFILCRKISAPTISYSQHCQLLDIGFSSPKRMHQEDREFVCCLSMIWSRFKSKKTKFVWTEVCKPKLEGGLGFKSLKEANQMNCLKLIWRIISNQPSLWVRWIQHMLIRQGSFWSVRDTTSAGSWLWRKLLKNREIAQSFPKIEIKTESLPLFGMTICRH